MSGYLVAFTDGPGLPFPHIEAEMVDDIDAARQLATDYNAQEEPHPPQGWRVYELVDLTEPDIERRGGCTWCGR